MQNELTYEQVKDHLKMRFIHDGDIAYKDLLNFEERGIQLTPMQANLMFLNRGYGKTFMTYCELLKENRMKEYFKINIDDAERDEDSQILRHTGKLDWLKGFIYFMKQYGKDFSIQNQKSTEVNFEKIR